MQALGSVDKPRHPEEAWCDEDPSTALKGRRDAYVPEDGAFRSVPVYDGHRLRYGQRIAGPAIVEEVTTAIVLTGAWDAIVDRYGSFVLYRKGRDDLVGAGARVPQAGNDGLKEQALKIDPILLSVYARTFKSITDEMSISMQQTTRSPILCEAKDFVTGLYDARGPHARADREPADPRLLARAGLQAHQGHFGDDIHPGDVFFHNDVFTLGNQNNDVAVFKPVFFDGELVAWTAVKGHQADIGGAVAGGYNPNAVEVWQEALRIPAVKMVEKGKLRKDVWDLIFANIRLDIVQHDMKAEIGACTVGERRFVELLGKYGREHFEAHKEALFDATRRMMEAEIAKIPNGRYSGEGRIYYDGRHEGSEFTIRVDIDVEDRKIRFDYSRTDAQTNGFVNGTFTSSASATILTLLQMVNPDIPAQRGHGRADRDRDPRGHDPQRRLSEGHDLRQPPVPAERRRDPARARAGPARPGHRRLEQPALLAHDRHRPGKEATSTSTSASWA